MSELEKELLAALKAVTEWAGKDSARMKRQKKMDTSQYFQWQMETLNNAAKVILKAEERGLGGK